MKKQTMYNHLQKQYAKLNLRIQKAMQTGRFYAYTQFKQEQLLSRLKRCSFQLKQLGAGVAVVAALGMATPAVGQTFMQKTGANNPFDFLSGSGLYFYGTSAAAVDIDDDGDMDIFVPLDIGGSSVDREVLFYENTGTSNAPIYTLQTGSVNPFDGETDLTYINFADIDGDGDQDAVCGAYYTNSFDVLHYYENTGDSTNAVFVERVGSSNPLNIIKTTVGTGPNTVHPSFADLDNDGDLDCTVGVLEYSGSVYSSSVWYYENTGSATNPVFVHQSGASNPFAAIAATLEPKSFTRVEYADLDKDGDFDAFVMGSFLSNDAFNYYENTGTSMAPSFSLSTTTPLNSISGSASRTYILFDIDNDSDIDAVSGDVSYENLDTTIVGVSSINNVKEGIDIYPNPSTGLVNFERAITGNVMIYDVSGKLLLTRVLESKRELDLNTLNNGLYFIRVEEEKIHYYQKVMIQK